MSLLYTHSVGVRQERRLAPEEKSVAEALSLLMAFAVQGDAAEGARLLADEVVAHEACSLLNPPPYSRARGRGNGRKGGGGGMLPPDPRFPQPGKSAAR